MTTHQPTETVDTVVIGAGLAGLVAAATAADAGGRVVLLDAHAPGGRARTDRRGDFVFNRGPRALYRGGAASRILGDLGVRTDRGGVPRGASIRGLLQGRVVTLPHGPSALLRTPWLSDGEKMRFGRAFVEITRRDPFRQVTSGAGPGVVYLDGGWQTLVDRLHEVARSRGVEMRTGARVTAFLEAATGGDLDTLTWCSTTGGSTSPRRSRSSTGGSTECG